MQAVTFYCKTDYPTKVGHFFVPNDNEIDITIWDDDETLVKYVHEVTVEQLEQLMNGYLCDVDEDGVSNFRLPQETADQIREQIKQLIIEKDLKIELNEDTTEIDSQIDALKQQLPQA